MFSKYLTSYKATHLAEHVRPYKGRFEAIPKEIASTAYKGPSGHLYRLCSEAYRVSMGCRRRQDAFARDNLCAWPVQDL